MGLSDRIEFPESDFEGLIFDLDGTLVDSMPAHYEAWREALAAYGAAGILGEDVFYAMGGRPTHDIVVDLNGEHGLRLDPAAICLAKSQAYLRNLHKIEIYEEVVAYARRFSGKVPMAVATGSTRIGAERTLQAVGLSDLVDEVVTSDDVANGKPAPDIYLEAALRINVRPERCIAFEDAPAGIMAAHAAGMRVVAIPSPLRVRIQ